MKDILNKIDESIDKDPIETGMMIGLIATVIVGVFVVPLLPLIVEHLIKH